jgi:predicted peptidase
MDRFFVKAALALSAFMLFSCASTPKETVSADEAIVGVSVIGTIGMDGSKARAIVVEYDRDLSGTKLDLSTFAVNSNLSKPGFHNLQNRINYIPGNFFIIL